MSLFMHSCGKRRFMFVCIRLLGEQPHMCSCACAVYLYLLSSHLAYLSEYEAQLITAVQIGPARPTPVMVTSRTVSTELTRTQRATQIREIETYFLMRYLGSDYSARVLHRALLLLAAHAYHSSPPPSIHDKRSSPYDYLHYFCYYGVFS